MELSLAEKLNTRPPKEAYMGKEAMALVDSYLSGNISKGRLGELLNLCSGDLNLLESAKYALDKFKEVKKIINK